MNEELQAANEELEATTEELRSLNEELTTVNVQLREKIEQLEHAHNDLTNFFASTKIATLFLDEGLRIARFTPAAEELLRIDHGDVGRYVGDIARDLLHNDLVTEAQDVLGRLVAHTRELRTEDGRWLARSVLPYLTESRRIEGVVVTFVDVTTTREATEALAKREAQQAVIARLGLRALEDGDLESFLDHAVRVLRETLDADFTKILELQPGSELLLLRAGVGWGPGVVGEQTVPNSAESQVGYTLTAQRAVIVRDFADEARFSAPQLLVDHGVNSGISCVISGEGRPYGVIGVHATARRSFTPEDADFVQAAAVIIGSAISRTSTRTRLAVESLAAASLNDATSMVDATARVHAAFESVFGPGVSEVWVSDRDGGLERIALFSGAELERERVEHMLAVDRRIAEEGLIPRIAKSRRAEWVSSLQTARWFLRAEKARDLGLRSGVALPIGDGRGLLGVMTFLARQLLFADPVFLRSMESIGRMISEVTHRIEADERYRSTVASAPVGIGERTLDGRWISVNPELCVVTGRTAEELSATPITALTHPEDLERERPLLEAVRDGRSTGYTLETRYVRPDGETVWVNLSASLGPARPGKAPYCVLVVEDITTRKVAERDLRNSEARFRKSIQSSPVPVLLHDEEGRILMISTSWTEVTGYTIEDIGRRDDWLRLAFPDRVEEMQALAPTLFEEDVEPAEYELDVRTKSGETRRLLFRAVYLGRGPDGHALRFVAATDVTQQRLYERELVSASEQKDEFIAMLGHELRNPLAAVRSATELLNAAAPTRDSVDRVRTILARQTRQMAKLLDGLLDVSRIVRGKIELNHEIVDVTTTIREVVDDHVRDGMNEGVAIDVVGADSPIWVRGDPVRLTQIVGNLVTNATKYANDRGVMVTASEDDSTVRISVKDDGVGIEPGLLDDLFQPFRQGPQSYDRSRGGLGIGLALVKRLVELHGGSVEAHSEGLGRGAEFVVRLPRAEATPSAAPQVEDNGTARRILIIEDNEDAAEMLQDALRLRGHEVYLALRGTIGIEIARSERPDVVLCDLGLPDGVTGFDVARALRADPKTKALHLVALSGYARPEDRAKSEEAGFDAHLAKPVSIAEIERIVRSFYDRG